MTFPALPCEWISLDLMDISGEMHLDVVSLLRGFGAQLACAFERMQALPNTCAVTHVATCGSIACSPRLGSSVQP